MGTEIFRCAECGGTKVSELSGGKYRCLYCGAIFQTEPHSKPQPTFQPQMIVINQPVPQSQPSLSQEEVTQKAATSKNNSIKWLTCIGIISGIFAVIQFISYITDEYSYGHEHEGKLFDAISSLVICIIFLAAAYYTNHKKKRQNG